MTPENMLSERRTAQTPGNMLSERRTAQTPGNMLSERRTAQTPENMLSEIGMEILSAGRDELCLHFPYLNSVLLALPMHSGNTASIATDGESLFYNGAFLSERFLRSPTAVSRAFLHLMLHCMLRHLYHKKGKIPELWDLACDVSVESILDSLNSPVVEIPAAPVRKKFYGECLTEMKVLTAEGIYRHLLRRSLSEYELAALQRQFLADDHSLWNPENSRAEQQDQQWKERAAKTRTGMETVLAGQSTGGGEMLEQVKAAVRDDVDYRAFLQRFAVPREILSLDPDAFDYGFYSYGLRLYGNLPLVEPLETREAKRIEDFVIAIDTSMSTSGKLVRDFLASTYTILRSNATFTRKVNIRLIQCDDRIRSDIVLHDLDSLKEQMEHFALSGGSATDFRPVFEHVAQLRKSGAFTSLRGLIYFTDGMGIYPEKRPPYETAFILTEEPPLSIHMPPWAIRLILTPSDLERAGKKSIPVSDSGQKISPVPDFPEESDLAELPEL